jgi:hypothetical protein
MRDDRTPTEVVFVLVAALVMTGGFLIAAGGFIIAVGG